MSTIARAWRVKEAMRGRQTQGMTARREGRPAAAAAATFSERWSCSPQPNTFAPTNKKKLSTLELAAFLIERLTSATAPQPQEGARPERKYYIPKHSCKSCSLRFQLESQSASAGVAAAAID